MSNDTQQIVYHPESSLGPEVIDVLHLPIVPVLPVVLHFNSDIYRMHEMPSYFHRRLHTRP